MEPIVNPWLIYLVSIVEHLRNFFNAITFVVCALDILIVMGTFIESDDAIAVFYNREEIKSLPRLRKLYYEETQEDVDKLKDTMKVASELFLEL